ncbi:restriction endonuclease [Cupriavidus sp. H19C3]|uniref:restriction endonuclease n=1 Tax=Cupriavidus sp. H19C3 TaxID=3241603 RepID=UPI003BF8B13B
MTYVDWKHYQQATAEVFRRLGCNAQVDYQAKGARAKHDVDVYATFPRSGISCTWVIECKLWKHRVPKEKVMALRGIVEDLGADRGILISEAGFQPGAHDAARGTNITLITSLEDFERTALAATTEVPLQLSGHDGGDVYAFPPGTQPSDLLRHGDFIITANWAGCSISIINPSTKSIVRTIDLDKYDLVSNGKREIHGHPPGSLVVADGRLFVGQVFSDVIIVIDMATHAIIRRIPIPGGGEGQLSVSKDETEVYFASNLLSQFHIIDTATYALETVAYPGGGRGCLSILRHPSNRLLYLGVTRGGHIDGKGYPHANSYLAIYDLARREYVAEVQLAELVNGQADDAMPVCITYDDLHERVYVGMMQSNRGICVIDARSGKALQDIQFKPHEWSKPYQWVDPLSQCITDNLLLTVNRNNRELVAIDRDSLTAVGSALLGDAPNGPRSVVAWEGHAVVSYPGRNALIFVPLESLGSTPLKH